MSVFARAIESAVVLAAGRGTRMRRDHGSAALSEEQERAAADGVKAMMPIGRPFLDYVLSALADAGIRDVCIVVRAGDTTTRAHYAAAPHTRLNICIAEQREPRGTADAILSARACVGDVPFLSLNGDNYYPAALVRAILDARAPALGAFDVDALVAQSNIPPERVRAYAYLRVRADGMLDDIVEKPSETERATFGAHAPVSMNLWSFPPAMFAACERVAPSVRGELELVDAVRIAMRDFDVQFRAIPCATGVLDLSGRGDIAAVAAALRDVEARL